MFQMFIVFYLYIYYLVMKQKTKLLKRFSYQGEIK